MAKCTASRSLGHLRRDAKIARRAGEGGYRTYPLAGGRDASHAPGAAGLEREIRPVRHAGAEVTKRAGAIIDDTLPVDSNQARFSQNAIDGSSSYAHRSRNIGWLPVGLEQVDHVRTLGSGRRCSSLIFSLRFRFGDALPLALQHDFSFELSHAPHEI
jgi:hypothetical protein